MTLSGRVALVTGASRGIGAAVARALGGAGVHVAVTARSSARLEEVAEGIRQDGGRALAVPLDLREPGSAALLRQAVEQSLGPVELLISNAAAVEPLGPVWAAAPEAFAASVATNLLGAQAVLHAFVPPMLDAGFGRVVAVSSSAAHHAVPGLGAYCAGKAGFEHLHAVLAQDLAGTPVRVTTLWPGGTDTDMQAALRADASPLAVAARAARLGGRLRSPDEVAPHVLRLLAEEADAHGLRVDLGELPGTDRQGA